MHVTASLSRPRCPTGRVVGCAGAARLVHATASAGSPAGP